MPVQFLGPDPLEQEIREVLAAIDDLAAGRATAGRLERLRIDLKEEAGRRGPRGQILPGLAENEAARRRWPVRRRAWRTRLAVGR